MSKNLELFNQQTAEIFAVLWDNFPVPQVITYEKFNAALPDDYFDQLNSPEMKALNQLRSVVEGTFTFLSENGYIQYETDHEAYFYGVRLTEKALTVLNQKPEALGGNETMGDKIISAVKDGAPGVIAGAVTNLLTLGVNMVTSAS
ncbi:hypothetical protein DJ628_10885 [Salmonella enterica]|uniref:Uncharacterized protein n=4 Tax=Salmonella enterica I TaxID=59201 RepID=A0A5W3B0S3_SALHA|nr:MULTISPECIES: hypothetical protein [Salmonella]EAA0921688.1 hypothetical protein [Salmonella enterica subsp. enterica serovar Enteritidis]EAA1780341.1 hypothetical protein [Salmonella enterica subsp. diarizonae]EAA5345749.1 hypothetical protein [Salmonella enterica subsp. enterica serovar Thompson]EAA9136731.1 hypothetical protein [Salmonella enterica subsp. enterica serovar Mbandaka]EAM2365370.1 hypothetical protein [Salmonella enterica subsp. enterica serovar 4,[5],12:i:-]EBH2925321.1 hy